MRGGRRGFCHVSWAFNLKLLNYLQSFVGISIVVYSSWMLVYWTNHHAFPPYPPPAPAPSSAAPPDASIEGSWSRVFVRGRWSFDRGIASRFGDEGALGSAVSSFQLPAPWFIYSFMGVGIVLCSISFIGCIEAEALHGCCLCFYAVLVSLLLAAEATAVAFIAFDHHWEQDLPFDPTGELDSLRAFIDENADICKWIGITLLAVQGLSLLVAFVLRGLASPHRADYDYEDGNDGRARIREPLLNPQVGAAHNSVKGHGRSGRSVLWSSHVREKYGLNGRSSGNNASSSVKSQ